MPAFTREFRCVIHDPITNDHFSAKIVIQKKLPIRTSLQGGKVDLADIFITPISGQLLDSAVHNHFVVHDYSGAGVYIVRDQRNREEHRRECSVWDLGNSFATKIMAALQDLA